jgi:hypothetical protein
VSTHKHPQPEDVSGRGKYRRTEEIRNKLRKPKSPEHREKLRLANLGKFDGKNNPMYGRHHSIRSRDKIGKARIGKYSGKNNSMFGRHHSEKSKKQISRAMSGKKYPERCGKNNPSWNGGRCIKDGYIMILRRDYPNANARGYVYEHRLAMEKKLDDFNLWN